MKDIAIFGLGRLGKTLALSYSELGGKVIAVDKNQEEVDEIADYVTYAMRADISDENVIKKLGISNVDMAVITMGNNFEASVIVTAVCKEMGIPYIIAKAEDTLKGNVLLKVGADEIIYPEADTGRRMARNIAKGGSFVDIADFSEDFSIIEAKVPANWIGKSLMELNPRKKFGINVIAIQQDNKYKVNPDVEQPFDETMQLVVVGDNEHLDKVFK